MKSTETKCRTFADRVRFNIGRAFDMEGIKHDIALADRSIGGGRTVTQTTLSDYLAPEASAIALEVINRMEGDGGWTVSVCAGGLRYCIDWKLPSGKRTYCDTIGSVITRMNGDTLV